MVDWTAIKTEYEKSDITLSALSVKHGIKYPTVKSRKQRDKWRKYASKKNASKVKKDAPKNKDAKKTMHALITVLEEKPELTEKQKLFCLFYIRNFNATMAYLKAYECSYNAASVEGYNHLRNPKIKAEIAKMKDAKRQSIMLTEDDIVERYMRIAFADMTDFAGFGTESYPALDEAGNMLVGNDGNLIYRKRSYLEFKDHNQVDGGLICEISVGRQGMKVKLEDRQKGLEFLAKYFGMNPMDKHKMAYNDAVLKLRERELVLKEF